MLNDSVDARLVGCLLVTHLPVKAERQRRPELAGRPLVISTVSGARQSVVDAAAEALGVSAGQTVAEALSRCSGAVLTPFDAEYLIGFNDGLLAGLWAVAPAVEAGELGVFYLDLTGLAGVYGGMDGLASALLAAAPALRPRLGIGRGKFPAYCAARTAPAGDCQLAPGDVVSWLAPLPASWLPLPASLLRRLQSFGVRALGDVAQLTESALTDFLGPDGARAWQLAQGVDTSPLMPTLLPQQLVERLEFPFPVDTEAGIEAGLKSLAERLWRLPSLRGHVVAQAALCGALVSGGQWEFQRTFSSPAGDADTLVRALWAGLGARGGNGARRWPEGALLDLSLTVGELSPEAGRQALIFQPERVAGLVEVAGVSRPAAIAPQSALPERRWALGAALQPLNQPTAVAVDTVAETPRRVRVGVGRWRVVAQVFDRWEVDTEWWLPEPVNRSYWQLALADGGLLTVYRDLTTDAWFRQGF